MSYNIVETTCCFILLRVAQCDIETPLIINHGLLLLKHFEKFIDELNERTL